MTEFQARKAFTVVHDRLREAGVDMTVEQWSELAHYCIACWTSGEDFQTRHMLFCVNSAEVRYVFARRSVYETPGEPFLRVTCAKPKPGNVDVTLTSAINQGIAAVIRFPLAQVS